MYVLVCPSTVPIHRPILHQCFQFIAVRPTTLRYCHYTVISESDMMEIIAHGEMALTMAPE